MFLTNSKLSRQLGVSKTTLWRMKQRGELPPQKTTASGRKFWLEADITRWLNQMPEVKNPNKSVKGIHNE